MSKEKIVELHARIRQLVLKEGDRTNLEYILPLTQLLTEMILMDLSYSITHQMDGLLWKTFKEMIGRLQADKGKESQANLSNGIHFCLNHLNDIWLLAQKKYDLGDNQPEFISLSLSLKDNDRKNVDEKIQLAFNIFMCLRVGDLLRYGGEITMCTKLYKHGIVLNPTLGDCWNQMGIVALLKVNPLDALYYHMRAIHSSLPFPSASTNVNSLLKKYLHRQSNDDQINSSYSDQFLHVVAKCHFMQELDDEYLSYIGSKAINSKLIVMLLSALQMIGDGSSPDEIRARSQCLHLLSSSYKKIISLLIESSKINCQLFDEYLNSLYLLLRVPTCCTPCPILIEFLSKSTQQQTIRDCDYLCNFTCFSSTSLPSLSFDSLIHHLSLLNGSRGEPTIIRRSRTVLKPPLKED